MPQALHCQRRAVRLDSDEAKANGFIAWWLQAPLTVRCCYDTGVT